MPRSEENTNERSMFIITCAIGLLHGLGFSFVLHEILRVTSPDIWQSLLAFNVGVEIGQLLIVLMAWPLFRLTEHLSSKAWRAGRWTVASACAVIAFYWTAERTLSIFSAS